MKKGKADPCNYLFRRARVIDPARDLDAVADVLVVDGILTDIKPNIDLPSDRLAHFAVIDASEKWIVPGLIDMHVHLREPGEEYKETIATGTMAAVAGGYTAVACMPNTKPVNDCAAVTEYILERAREQGHCRVLPVGAVSSGLEGRSLAEFGELKGSGAVAVTDDGRPVANSMLMRRALEYAKNFDLPVISHAEDPALSEGGLMNEGPTSTLLGLHGIPKAAEEVMVARDLALAELTGARLHIAHVSTAGAVRMIGEAKSRGVPVTAETAPHYFTLTDDRLMTFDTLYKVNPPIRGPADVEAIKRGLADGTIDAVATDHAPHSSIEKDTEFEYAANGIIGLESALPLILELVREKTLTPSQAVAKVSCNPARILGLPLGTLLLNQRACMTYLDPEFYFVLDCTTFRSKSRNCPFHGQPTRGRALMTFFNGKVAFSRLSK
ncbi:dihydroorotase [Syntrophobacter fumaroxidans]|uniref:Dihydroorotase n=1 Tax=Syntrophobacter fumaroxidans (strain DSM 10017 / MPOB) TaxID=335543 RepID=PYRC_SYNFM|nr:dihydroorotase [Syntrophobacter fumaroxidans]A0LK22.1 RecName: Full=Dihydroorotase; Short=DHOase [Syntrophobacter fumaroxidans MPOB]ABK17774.1 dihydroorotase [Syntrophobacter fumaroxidans MPOB]